MAVFAPFYDDGSIIVPFLGLAKTAYLLLYCIDLVYGWISPFFPYDYCDLDKMLAFKNLIALFGKLLAGGCYYLFDTVLSNILVLSFVKCWALPEETYF